MTIGIQKCANKLKVWTLFLKKAMDFHAVDEDTISMIKTENYLRIYRVRAWLKLTYVIVTTIASDCSAPSVMPLKKRAVVAFVAMT